MVVPHVHGRIMSPAVSIEQEKVKLGLLKIFLVIAVIPLFSFAVIDFFEANYFECALELFSGLWMLACLLLLGRLLSTQWVSNSMSTVIGLLFVYLAAYGDANGSKLYFSFIYPVFTFYLQGTKNGLPWNVVFFLFLLIILINPTGLEFVYDYPIEGSVRFLVAYSLVTVLSYFYENVRNRIQRDLEAEKDKLSQAHNAMEAANIKLQSANEESKRLAKEANQANQAKSEFLANMSHELRTPLNGVVGTSHLLQQTEITEEQRELAKIIQTSSESLLEIINDILDFSKIEAGKLDLESVDFDLHCELEKFLDSMAYRAHEKGLEIIAEIADDVPPFLCGDPGRLRQILTNIVGNAIKFTETGEIILRVQVEKNGGDQISLHFLVSDTGIGISAENMQLLFKSFSQIDSSATRKYGGTGLGLMISKRLTEMMDGQIGVQSREGEGSEFWFTARFTQQVDAPEQIITVPPALQEKRILVMETNDTNRSILHKLISSWGMVCQSVREERDAIALLKEAAATGCHYDFALFCWQSGTKASEILAKEMTNDDQLEKTRLILMIPLTVVGQHRLSEAHLFSETLTKPVKKLKLYQCLTDLAGIEADHALVGSLTSNEGDFLVDQSISSPSSLSILLVEDNDINQFVARKLLVKLGHEVNAVANGQEAIQAMQKNCYDIVLMDCQMPVMDGYEATRIIRGANPDLLDCNIPIVAMTAHAVTGDESKCLESGMSDYLSKPVEPENLKKILKKWRGKKHTKEAIT
ncbi:MAG: ATP-binding protein [Desulfocapsaceae bacterium]|nr:ATP-binding protein [Desulfocapsaceae bacterium]